MPFAPALTVDEFMRDPQVAAAEMLVELNNPTVGSMRQIGLPIQFQRTHQAGFGSRLHFWAKTTPASGLVLRTWKTQRLKQGRQSSETRGAPFSGVRILDFSSFIAGPLGPVFLADLGADVIEIESRRVTDCDSTKVFWVGIAGSEGFRSISNDQNPSQSFTG